jgi:competence protein ComEC
MSDSRPRLPRVHVFLLAVCLAGACLWRWAPPLPAWLLALVPLLSAFPRLRRGLPGTRLFLAGVLLFLVAHAGGREDSRPPDSRPAGLDPAAASVLRLEPVREPENGLAERRRAEGGDGRARPVVCRAWTAGSTGWIPLPGRLEVWPREGRCPPLRSRPTWLLARRPGREEPLWDLHRAASGPHALDRRELAWSRGRVGRLGLDTTKVWLEALDGSPEAPSAAHRLREACARRLLRGSGEGGAWLVAILLGETAWLPAHDVAAWQATGLAHLLAVSGLNVGVLALCLGHGLSPLPVPGWLRDLLLAALLALYVPLAGNQVSVERAVGMALLLLVSRRLGRPQTVLSVLALAAACGLWLDPGELARPGFQMSYGAVAGLVLAAPGGKAAPGVGRLRRMAGWLATALGVSLAAQAGVVLTQLSCFGALPLSGLLLNLAAVPLSSALTVAGFLHLLLPLPGEPLGALSEVLALAIVQLARHMPVASLDWDPHPLQLLLLGLALAALLAPGARGRWRLSCAAGLALGSAQLLPSLAPRPAGVLLMDVGQGDALLLRSPSGQAVLVDAGWSNPLQADTRGVELARALGRIHAGPLDWLVLTHPDQDHLGGARDLLDSPGVRRVLWNGEWKDNGPQRALRAALERHGTPMVTARPGQLLARERDWRLGVLGPPAPRSGREGNERSIVLRLESGLDTLLLTSDMGLEEEEDLAGWGPWWRAGVLKAGHHGSRGSSGAGFLARVGAREAWISSGRGNRYGHPHPEVLERLARAGVLHLHRTDRQGWLWRPARVGDASRPPRSMPQPRLRLDPAAGPPPTD